MTARGLLGLAAVAFVLSVSMGAPLKAQDSFGYTCENCPANWPNLNISGNNCGGAAQSPIALSDGDGDSKRRLPRLRVRYGDAELLETAKSTNVEWEDENAGENTIRLRGKTFSFLQFHFHSTSEHVVNGERAPLEMHLVHQAGDGSLAVVAVFIQEGRQNRAFEEIVDSIEEDGLQTIDVDLEALLPSRLTSFRYRGSTTTPPCTGGVQWILLKRSIELSEDQIAAIQGEIRGINDGFDNNRAVQNREHRRIAMDRSRSGGNDDDDDNGSDDDDDD